MKFLRRASHSASIVTLLVWCGTAIAAQQRGALPNAGGTQPNSSQAQGQQSARQGDVPRAEIRLSGEPVTININPTPAAPQAPPPQQLQGESTNYSNWVLAFLTFGLLIASGLQWQSVRRQADAMDGQLTALRAQLTTAEENTALNRRSTDLTYQALNMAHRAKLTVRNVTIDLGFATSITGGKLWVTNTGYTPAMILKTYATWIVAERLPMENPALAAIVGEHPIDKTLDSGEALQLELPTTERLDMAGFQALQRDQPTVTSIYLVGVVKYRDNLTVLRRTFFCRRFDRQLQRFIKVDDLDYEYED